MKNIDKILKNMGTEFNIEKEKELVKLLCETYHFPKLNPEYSAAYFDKLLDATLREKEKLRDNTFSQLLKHSITARPCSEEKYAHLFYRRGINGRLEYIKHLLRSLGRMRMTFRGKKTILTQNGYFTCSRPSAETEREYTSLITLENLIEPGSYNEHFRFEVFSNNSQHITGQVFFDDKLKEYILFDMIIHDNGKTRHVEDLDNFEHIKLLNSTHHILRPNQYVQHKYEKQRVSRRREHENIHIINTGEEISSVLPFRYRTFSSDKLDSGRYAASLDGLVEDCTELCRQINEKPVYEVYLVERPAPDNDNESDKFQWISVCDRPIGSTESPQEVYDLIIRAGELLRGYNTRVLVTYEQGYKPLILDGLPPGTPKVPHFRRLQKKAGMGYVFEDTLIGGSTELGKEVFKQYKELKSIRCSYHGNFKDFLETGAGQEYLMNCQRLVQTAREATMTEDNIDTMIVMLGIHYKTGEFSEGFFTGRGRGTIQIYRDRGGLQ